MKRKKDISGFYPEKESFSIPSGTNYLFTIGIDNYLHCSKLHNAVKDTRDLTNVLYQKYNFEAQRHFKLENEAANKENIIDTFRQIKQTIQPKDNLLIYYSGHGELDKDFDESFWVTVEGRKGKIGDYLSLESLLKYVKAIKTHHTVLMIDSCFAGASLVNRKSTSQALERDPSRYVIASGRREFADDGVPGTNSPFAAALLEKLQGNQESLSVMSLGEYVKHQTIKATKEAQRPFHNPLRMAEDKGGEFVFHLKAANEEQVWAATLTASRVTDFRAYLEKYPDGQYKEDAFWQIALIEEDDIAYDSYLAHFPNGKHAKQAEQKMLEIEDEQMWEMAQDKNSLSAYRRYLRHYSKYKEAALAAIDAIKKTKAAKKTTIIPDKPSPIITPTPHIIKTPNLFTDPRDGQQYKTVKLKDGKVWMAQNLNFDVGEGCGFYKNDPENGGKYGRLYTWDATLKACPEGWHLPSDAEWWEMTGHYGKAFNFQDGQAKSSSGDAGKEAYKRLIEGGDSGFSALLGGYRGSDGSFGGVGDSGNYWSSTELDSSSAYLYYFGRSNNGLYRHSYIKSLGFSCRCIQG